MKPEPQLNHAEAVALERFALISKIQDLLDRQWPLTAALDQVVLCPLNLPEGRQKLVARRTLEDWWYAYQQGGFAALQPKTRADRGTHRQLTPEQAQRVLEQAQTHLAVPLTVLCRQWRQADPQLPSLSTIYRFLREKDLSAKTRRQRLTQPVGGPTKAFEAPCVNDLWMGDFSPGPVLHPPHGPPLATHLCLLVDDRSRLVPYAAYYAQADTQAFHATLKEAIRRRGLPHKLYTDNGGPFINDHTKVVCARLGIRLLHAAPYHSWSKGKCERLLHTIQQDFELTLTLPGQAVFSREDLNARFAQWLQTVYHLRIHSATGLTPQERYQREAALVRSLDPQLNLEQLFYAEVRRRVRRDGTVRLDNQLYEVDLALRTLEVTLRYDPFGRDPIEVYYRQQAFGLARKVNLQLNSLWQPERAYENRPQS